ncbi:MAG: MBL fold metallo-hydrolase [Desulfobacterales bacterium]|nr:MBL fold metallo-hydrolase [Desulfobacterales bacterium]
MKIPVAIKWFESTPMEHGITLIREWALAPETGCNIWHIRGDDRDLLFDSGTGLISLKESLPDLFTRPVICVSSHSHFDHAGGSYEFEDFRIHESEAPVICSPDRKNTTVQGFLTNSMFSASPFKGFDADLYQVRAARPAAILEEGDIIDLGNRAFTVLHLPGHSPGSIGLYEESTGYLFSGDALFDGHLYDDVYHSNIQDWVKTMKRFAFIDVRKVFGGHFHCFGPNRMQVIIDQFLQKQVI